MPAIHLRAVVALGAAALLAAACSPTFATRPAPERAVIVVPQGTAVPPGAVVVCADGRRPPC